MFDSESRTKIKRIPRQKRSQARFDAVLSTALRLFAARGYESVSMREIAREAKIPIASVYQYFPTKLAIVREMWNRYTSTISETLEAGINRHTEEQSNDTSKLIGTIVDQMAELQASTPAFIEIWSCVAASIELRALNVQDTLRNARLIASALQQRHPAVNTSVVFDRALIAIEMASATTRFALMLPEPHRARILLSLKAALSFLLDPAVPDQDAFMLSGKKRTRRTGRARGATPKPRPITTRKKK